MSNGSGNSGTSGSGKSVKLLFKGLKKKICHSKRFSSLEMVVSLSPPVPVPVSTVVVAGSSPVGQSTGHDQAEVSAEVKRSIQTGLKENERVGEVQGYGHHKVEEKEKEKEKEKDHASGLSESNVGKQPKVTKPLLSISEAIRNIDEHYLREFEDLKKARREKLARFTNTKKELVTSSLGQSYVADEEQQQQQQQQQRCELEVELEQEQEPVQQGSSSGFVLVQDQGLGRGPTPGSRYLANGLAKSERKRETLQRPSSIVSMSVKLYPDPETETETITGIETAGGGHDVDIETETGDGVTGSSTGDEKQKELQQRDSMLDTVDASEEGLYDCEVKHDEEDEYQKEGNVDVGGDTSIYNNKNTIGTISEVELNSHLNETTTGDTTTTSTITTPNATPQTKTPTETTINNHSYESLNTTEYLLLLDDSERRRLSRLSRWSRLSKFSYNLADVSTEVGISAKAGIGARRMIVEVPPPDTTTTGNDVGDLSGDDVGDDVGGGKVGQEDVAKFPRRKKICIVDGNFNDGDVDGDSFENEINERLRRFVPMIDDTQTQTQTQNYQQHQQQQQKEICQSSSPFSETYNANENDNENSIGSSGSGDSPETPLTPYMDSVDVRQSLGGGGVSSYYDYHEFDVDKESRFYSYSYDYSYKQSNLNNGVENSLLDGKQKDTVASSGQGEKCIGPGVVAISVNNTPLIPTSTSRSNSAFFSFTNSISNSSLCLNNSYDVEIEHSYPNPHQSQSNITAAKTQNSIFPFSGSASGFVGSTPSESRLTTMNKLMGLQPQSVSKPPPTCTSTNTTPAIIDSTSTSSTPMSTSMSAGPAFVPFPCAAYAYAATPQAEFNSINSVNSPPLDQVHNVGALVGIEETTNNYISERFDEDEEEEEEEEDEKRKSRVGSLRRSLIGSIKKRLSMKSVGSGSGSGNGNGNGNVNVCEIELIGEFVGYEGGEEQECVECDDMSFDSSDDSGKCPISAKLPCLPLPKLPKAVGELGVYAGHRAA
ncbi:unnamed protein product [Ambrosiozyma monospora]|uniref:Unnamed protein product n=2 Tax=Ambrosiozyma monospora TaxID=43982 RepID=A0ACB5SYZ3_AMBMO|nr:unnamed protein product [Ambrosiozyma monospora]